MIYKKAYDIDLSKYDEVLTITIKGIEVPLWRAMERYLRVVNDKIGNEPVPFIFNFAQKALYAQICEQKIHGKPMRQTILKARQLGMSTFIAGIFFMEAMFTSNTRWCVLADQKEHAQNIFSMYKFFYDHLNDCYDEKTRQEIEDYPKMHRGVFHKKDMRPELDTKITGKVMITSKGHSRIEVLVAGESAGRSASYTGIHSSETAFQKGLQKTITAMNMTVKSTNPNTMIFYETTANGFNEFKDKWDKDMAGQSDFEATFFPWYIEPLYSQKLNDNSEETEIRHLIANQGWLYQRFVKHKSEVNIEQMNWYYRQYLNYGDKDKCLQELPFEPLDSFKASGLAIFDMENISQRLNERVNATRLYGAFPYEHNTLPNDDIIFTASSFNETPDGHWIVYKLPEKHVPYVCIADPSGGHGGDFSCVQVINNLTWEQCATFLCNTADQVDCAYELMSAGYFYNTALISMENNEINRRGIDILVRAHYPKIYVDKDRVFENTNQNLKSTLGHSTDMRTRSGMIEDFRLGFKEHPEMINDIETLNEMTTFQYKTQSSGSLKSEAQGYGAHDDAVMAFAPFWRVREQQSKSLDISAVPNNKGEISIDELEKILQANFRARATQEQKQENSYENNGWC